MVTSNSWSDTRQISAAPNSHQYLILLVPFRKMVSFETKWIAFFGAKLHCFLACLHSSAKAMGYADKTLLCKDTTIQATQRGSNIFVEYQHLTNDYTCISTHWVLYLPRVSCKKAKVANSCLNKIKFLHTIVILR